MLIKEVAKNNNVTQEDVLSVVETILGDFPKHIMSKYVERETGTFPSVRVPAFGIFHVSPKKKYYLEQLEKSKIKDEPI